MSTDRETREREIEFQGDGTVRYDAFPGVDQEDLPVPVSKNHYVPPDVVEVIRMERDVEWAEALSGFIRRHPELAMELSFVAYNLSSPSAPPPDSETETGEEYACPACHDVPQVWGCEHCGAPAPGEQEGDEDAWSEADWIRLNDKLCYAYGFERGNEVFARLRRIEEERDAQREALENALGAFDGVVEERDRYRKALDGNVIEAALVSKSPTSSGADMVRALVSIRDRSRRALSPHRWRRKMIDGIVNGSLLYNALRTARKQDQGGDGEYGSPDDLEWLEDAIDPGRQYRITLSPTDGDKG